MSESGAQPEANPSVIHTEDTTVFPETKLHVADDGTITISPNAWQTNAITTVAQGRQLTQLAPDGITKDAADHAAEMLPATPNQTALSRRERRALQKTLAFKASYRAAILDEREPHQLTHPKTWFRPTAWFEAERTVSTKAKKIISTAVEVTFFDQARQDLLDKEVSRRSFAKGVLATLGVAAATGAALTIRHEAEAIGQAMERRWPENKPSFQFLGSEGYTGEKQIAIFFPGFGDIHSEKEAHDWHSKGHIKKDVPTAYLDYSNQGANPKELAELIRSSVDTSQLESLILFGRSMGGPMEIAVAAELGIPVKSMILCSSPFEIADGNYGKFGKDAARMPSDKQIAAEVKVGFNLWRALQRHGYDLPHVFAEAWQQTMSGASPWALQNEEKFLANFDFYDKAMDKKLEQVFIRGWTDIMYAESEHPSTDKTVRDIHSSLKYAKGLEKCFGIRLRIGKMPYKGHANVSVTADTLQDWIDDSTRPKPPPKVLAAK